MWLFSFMHSYIIFFKNKTLYKLWARFIRKQSLLLTREFFFKYTFFFFIKIWQLLASQIKEIASRPPLSTPPNLAPVCLFFPKKGHINQIRGTGYRGAGTRNCSQSPRDHPRGPENWEAACATRPLWPWRLPCCGLVWVDSKSKPSKNASGPQEYTEEALPLTCPEHLCGGPRPPGPRMWTFLCLRWCQGQVVSSQLGHFFLQFLCSTSQNNKIIFFPLSLY